MNTHIVCNQIMTMLHRHTLFAEYKLLYPFVKLRTFIFQPIHVCRKKRILDTLHIKPDISRNDARIARFVNNVELLLLQSITQRQEIVKETPHGTPHPFLRTINMLYAYPLVIRLPVRMEMRRVYHNFMPPSDQSHGNIFCKLLEAPVVVRYATGADKCYFHRNNNLYIINMFMD